MQYGKVTFSHKEGVIKMQKKCCSVAKQKQHKQNKLDFNFNILSREIQEWTNFGFDNSQIMFLVHRVIGGNSNGL